MKKTPYLFLIAFMFYFSSCSTDGNEVAGDSDSLSLAPDSAEVLDSSEVLKGSSLPKDPQSDLNYVLKDILSTIRSKGDLSKLNKYIDPKFGMYQIYTVGDANKSFDKYDQLEVINGDEANGPGPDSYLEFSQRLAKVDTALFNIKYDLVDADECNAKRKGTFGFLLQNQIGFLSDTYTSIQNTIGEDVDKAKLNELENTESTANEKIILSLFDRSTGNGADVFYFELSDGKWYLLAMDLTDCGGK